MQNHRNWLTSIFRQRWWKSFPFVLVIGGVTFIGWAAWQVAILPYDGILNIQPSGIISDLDPSGPASGKLQEGDMIIAVDGIPYREASTNYGGKRAGAQVDFTVNRDGEIKQVILSLAEPSAQEILLRLMPIIVAFVFLMTGSAVLIFKPADTAADLFFIWCFACATTLTAGVASFLGPKWTPGFFNAAILLLGPLSVLFHARFPQAVDFKGKRALIAILFILALLGIIIHLLIGLSGARTARWYPAFLLAGRAFLAMNILLVVAQLTYTYWRTNAPGVRGKIRLVALGGGITALLFVTLTILPDVLLQQPFIPYNLAFLILGMIPLTYGYAIFRLHLIEIDKTVNRGATFILVYSIIGGFYLVLSWIMSHFLPFHLGEEPLVNTILVLVLAGVFFPLRNQMQRLVDRVFYGGWYDYRLGVMQITRGLDQITDLNSLASLVSQRLVDTLRLEESCTFLRDPAGDFTVIEVAWRKDYADHPVRSYPVLPRSSLTYLLRIGAVERANLRRALSEVVVTPEELQLLNSEQIHLWVPVIGRGQILGLLALGPKLGGDVFSGEDLDILRVVARQIGPIIENIHLFTRLKEYAATLEKRVEERTAQLFDAKERVEAILASVGDGVIVTDLVGNILAINAAFEKQSGFSAAEITGQNLYKLLEESNTPEVLSEMYHTLKSGEIWSGELVARNKAGKLYDVELKIAPVHDQSGQIVNYVGSQRDITRWKELDRMKDAFVADVSHELRTPTTNISLYLDLLESSPPDKQAQYITVIKEQSRILTKLVEDILDLSRLARVKARKIEFAEVDLNLIIEQAFTAHRPLAIASGIDLIFQPETNLPKVYGIENLLSQVIYNLVSNAIRYTLQGSVQICSMKSGDGVSFVVKDTGIGIEKEDIPHIFERFYRGRNVRQSNIPGTGLGLAIVNEIVELHRGTISVQSELGKGSIFTVWLPTSVS